MANDIKKASPKKGVSAVVSFDKIKAKTIEEIFGNKTYTMGQAVGKLWQIVKELDLFVK